jgi:hypothetical protein
VSARWGVVEVVGELELECAVGGQPSLPHVVDDDKRAVQIGAPAGRAGFGKPVSVKSPAPWSERACQPFTCQSMRPTNHTPPLCLGNFFRLGATQYCTESLSAAQRLSACGRRRGAFRPLDVGARWCMVWGRGTVPTLLQGRRRRSLQRRY